MRKVKADEILNILLEFDTVEVTVSSQQKLTKDEGNYEISITDRKIVGPEDAYFVEITAESTSVYEDMIFKIYCTHFNGIVEKPTIIGRKKRQDKKIRKGKINTINPA